MSFFVFIIAVIFTIGAVGCAGIYTLGMRERLELKKQVIDPKVHFPQEGICQCADAYCYHANGQACQVKNCPCTVFVSSALKGQALDEMSHASVALATASFHDKRLSLEVANQHKQRQLER